MALGLQPSQLALVAMRCSEVANSNGGSTSLTCLDPIVMLVQTFLPP